MSRAVSRLIIGTRGSALALWQAEHVAGLLRARLPAMFVTLRTYETHGDRAIDRPLPEIGGKGLFTAEIEAGLLAGEVDLAVHSLKDLPTQPDPRFTLGAIPPRGSPYDVLISRDDHKFARLPAGATLGTGSPRRTAQAHAARPDLTVIPIRGNVPTRIDKLFAPGSPFDGVILAAAGLDRLGLAAQITETLDPALMLPAPGQGALVVQCRTEDEAVIALLDGIDDFAARLETTAERSFLATLEGGCQLPVAAMARFDPGLSRLRLQGRVSHPDGIRQIDLSDDLYTLPGIADPGWYEQQDDALNQARRMGRALAEDALDRGAGDLLL